MRKSIKTGAPVVATLLAVGCSSVTKKTEIQTGLEKQKSSDVTLVFHANRYGVIEPCGCHSSPYGGIDRELNAISQLRLKHPSLLFFDAGDLLAPPPNPNVPQGPVKEKAKVIAKMVNEMGLRVFAPGFTDYALGVNFLREIEKENKYPFLSSNVVDATGKPIFKSFAIETVEGVRYGFLSLSSPKELESLTDKNGFKVLDPDATLNEWLPKLRQQADFIIVLSQLNNTKNQEISKNYGDIKLLVASDSRFTQEQPFWFDGHTLMIDPAKEGMQMSELNIHLELPFKGFNSKSSIDKNLAKQQSIQAMLQKDPTNPQLIEFAQAKDSDGQVAPIEGGSDYTYRLIPLIKEKFGTPNRFSKLMAKFKESIRRSALGE